MLKSFTSSNGYSFTADAGFFDKLTQSSPIPIPGATVTFAVERKNGVKFIYSDVEGTATLPAAASTDTGSAEAATSAGWVNPYAGYTLRLRRIVDRNNNVITLVYEGANGNGRLTSVKDPTNRALNFSYPSSTQTAITDPASRTWTLIWDTGNHLLQVDNSATGVSTRSFKITYNDYGSIKRITTLKDWKTNAEDAQH